MDFLRLPAGVCCIHESGIVVMRSLAQSSGLALKVLILNDPAERATSSFWKITFRLALSRETGTDVVVAKENSNSMLWWLLRDTSSKRHQPLTFIAT